jgi:GNAT superfamily N-acetyltransferase
LCLGRVSLSRFINKVVTHRSCCPNAEHRDPPPVMPKRKHDRVAVDGECTTVRVNSGNTLFFLLEAMRHDEECTGDSFYGNRRLLAEAWKRDELWCAGTTEQIDGEVQAAAHGYACQYDDVTDTYLYLFPACLWITPYDNTAKIVWVHSAYRRRGIASAMVRARTPGAAEDVQFRVGFRFWKSLGFTLWTSETNTMTHPRSQSVTAGGKLTPVHEDE